MLKGPVFGLGGGDGKQTHRSHFCEDMIYNMYSKDESTDEREGSHGGRYAGV